MRVLSYCWAHLAPLCIQISAFSGKVWQFKSKTGRNFSQVLYMTCTDFKVLARLSRGWGTLDISGQMLGDFQGSFFSCSFLLWIISYVLSETSKKSIYWFSNKPFVQACIADRSRGKDVAFIVRIIPSYHHPLSFQTSADGELRATKMMIFTTFLHAKGV